MTKSIEKLLTVNPNLNAPSKLLAEIKEITEIRQHLGAQYDEYNKRLASLLQQLPDPKAGYEFVDSEGRKWRSHYVVKADGSRLEKEKFITALLARDVGPDVITAAIKEGEVPVKGSSYAQVEEIKPKKTATGRTPSSPAAQNVPIKKGKK